jgi:hypothetical protein
LYNLEILATKSPGVSGAFGELAGFTSLRAHYGCDVTLGLAVEVALVVVRGVVLVILLGIGQVRASVVRLEVGTIEAMVARRIGKTLVIAILILTSSLLRVGPGSAGEGSGG